jgi:chlorobactene glucosyltransferase
MEYLAWFVFGFATLRLMVAIVNVIFVERLSGRKCDPVLVSVLVPARNESENIGDLIDALLSQPYRNIELIVGDDQSDDNTAQIVREYAQQDSRIKLISVDALPDGWLGKNHACHVLSSHAKGRYYLFVDADVRIQGDVIHQLVAYAQHYQTVLVSVFPKQMMRTLGEKMVVPLMNHILLSLLPLILVRLSKRSSLAAANGQVMMFDAVHYQHLLPHRQVKSEKVEDIAIARLLKHKRLSVACLTGDHRVVCRMYQGWKEAGNGFAKNVVAFFGGSMSMAMLFYLTGTFGVFVVAAFMHLKMLALFVLMSLMISILVSMVSRQHAGVNLLLLIPRQMALGIVVLKAMRGMITKQYIWKGRNVY